jgi:hypothetical protein
LNELSKQSRQKRVEEARGAKTEIKKKRRQNIFHLKKLGDRVEEKEFKFTEMYYAMWSRPTVPNRFLFNG